MKKVLINTLASTFLALFSLQSQAISDIIMAPYPQSTNNTCQSYAIAYALASSSYLHNNIKTPKALRSLEKKVRQTIDNVANEKGWSVYSHKTWQEAVKRQSSNNLSLKIEYTDDPNWFYQKVREITGINSAAILDGPISVALIKKPILTSVEQLAGNIYKSGHIVTLLGLAAPMSSNRSIAQANHPVMVLNSAVKSGQKIFNMCSESITLGDKKYSAAVTVSAPYKLKKYGGKYMLMYITDN